MGRVFLGAVLTICLLAILVIVQGHDQANFELHGRVYCDPCRVKFETRLSYPIESVKLQLECKNIENNTVSFRTNAKTCADGSYTIKVPGEHQDDICEVSLKKKPSHHCSDVMNGLDKDQISLTIDAGVAGRVRYANDLGYMTKDIHHDCLHVIEELAIVPDL